MLAELKQRISEGILEGANLLVSVKKEKMLELAAEKVDKAASSPEITWVLEKTMDESQVKGAFSLFLFLASVFFMSLGLSILVHLITTPDISDTNYHVPPEGRRRSRRA